VSTFEETHTYTAWVRFAGGFVLDVPRELYAMPDGRFQPLPGFSAWVARNSYYRYGAELHISIVPHVLPIKVTYAPVDV